MSARTDPKQLEGEIATLRSELGELVTELDHRRKRALDVPLQLRKHAVPLALSAVGLGVIIAGTVVLLTRRHHAQRRLSVRARKIGKAVSRVARNPEIVTRDEPGLLGKVLAAALTALASAGGKRLIERAILPRKQIQVMALPLPLGAPPARA